MEEIVGHIFIKNNQNNQETKIYYLTYISKQTVDIKNLSASNL